MGTSATCMTLIRETAGSNPAQGWFTFITVFVLSFGSAKPTPEPYRGTTTTLWLVHTDYKCCLQTNSAVDKIRQYANTRIQETVVLQYCNNASYIYKLISAPQTVLRHNYISQIPHRREWPSQE